MAENVEFIVKLLSDNLALGMQTRVLDEGASLQQTLDLLKGGMVRSVAILDENNAFVTGLNADKALFIVDTVVNTDTLLMVRRTMKDSDGKVQGSVEIHFSKDSFVSSIKRFMAFIWIAGIMTLVLVLVAGTVLSNRIIGPLNNSISMLQDIASGEGDLTKRLRLASEDEVGVQSLWMNLFMEKLQAMIREIKANADELNVVSLQLASTSSETSGLAQNMKTKAGQSASIMDMMSGSLRNIMQSANDSSASVKSIALSIETMSQAMDEVAQNCQQESKIAKKADEMARNAREKIKALEEVTRQIGKITKFIQDIADKTNLLALNATIEAASAGKAGLGFAVVAKEVKELAKQTSKATSDINTQIQNIRGTVESTITEIGGIATIINEVNTISQTIAAATEEQSATTQEILRNVRDTSSSTENMKGTCKQNVDTISQISANISEVNTSADKTEQGVQKNRENIISMTGTVNNLHKLVGKFKT